jgi:hypothetical protein
VSSAFSSCNRQPARSPCRNVSPSSRKLTTFWWLSFRTLWPFFEWARCLPTSNVCLMQTESTKVQRSSRVYYRQPSEPWSSVPTRTSVRLARLLTRGARTRRCSSSVGVSVQEVRYHLTLPFHLYGAPTGERVAFGMENLVHLLCHLHKYLAMIVNCASGKWTGQLTNWLLHQIIN